MKAKTSLVAILLFSFFICNLSTCTRYEKVDKIASDLQGEWIGVTSYQPGLDTSFLPHPILISFQEDRWENIRCTTENGWGEIQQDSGTYSIIDSTLYLHHGLLTDTIQLFPSSKPSLHFKIGKYRYHYERLSTFNKGSEIEKVRTTLTGRQFRFTDSGFEIEFLDEERWLCPDLSRSVSHHQTWLLFAFQGELFFWTPSTFDPVLQVKTLEPLIEFRNYWSQPQTITLAAQHPTLKYNLDELKGEWQERISEEDRAALQDFGALVGNEWTGEVLHIRDSILVSAKWNRKDTLVWAFNVFRDKLIFPEEWGQVDNRQWNILALGEEELLLERKASARLRRLGKMTEQIWFDHK